MTSYKGGHCTIACGNIHFNGFVFQSGWRENWVIVTTRTDQDFARDSKAIHFLLENCTDDKTWLVWTVYELVQGHDLPTMNAYDYAYRTSPEFREEIQERKHQ